MMIFVILDGTLDFVTGKKLQLPCMAIMAINNGGRVEPGGGGGNSNVIDICGQTVWKAGDGVITGPRCLSAGMGPGCNTSLPVNLISFLAKQSSDGHVSQRCITASEINNDYFEVHRSNNGEDYSSAGRVIGNGNSSLINNYKFDDYQQFIDNRITYYKLRQVDYDGTAKTYGPIKAVNNIQNKFTILSNPVQRNTPICFRLSRGASLLVLTDITGRVIVTKDFGRNSEDASCMLSEKLNPGLYTATLWGGENGLERERFIVEP
jgi:hypothetical protein